MTGNSQSNSTQHAHSGNDQLARVLLIEDDRKLGEMIQQYLTDNGLNVTYAINGTHGLQLHASQTFDAIVLDLMLPDVDGLEICRRIRTRDNIPMLMLTAKGDPMDRVIGLELGADDYVPKPFEPRELLARVRALLRRGQAHSPGAVTRFGRLEIDREALQVRLEGKRCNLTVHQFHILDTLSRASGRVLSREHLLTQIQGVEADSFDRSIDVHISRIRAEIEDDPRHPRRVITVRGAGYVFAKSQD